MSKTEPLSELDIAGWPTNWRADWEVRENASPRPQAWHRSGVCVLFEFEQVDECGTWEWVVYEDDVAISRLYELRAALGDDAFAEFWMMVTKQAGVLWGELGHVAFRLGD